MWKIKLEKFRKQDGFPSFLSVEVMQLKIAIAKAKQRGLDPQFELEVQNVIRNMIALMPFASKFRELGQATQYLCSFEDVLSATEIKIEEQRILSLYFELESDNSFKRFYKALNRQGILELPFLKDWTKGDRTALPKSIAD